jgi:hypothetical protein
MAILNQEKREEAMQQRIKELETNMRQTTVDLMQSNRMLKENASALTLHHQSPKNKVSNRSLTFDYLSPNINESMLTSLSQGEAFQIFDAEQVKIADISYQDLMPSSS